MRKNIFRITLLALAALLTLSLFACGNNNGKHFTSDAQLSAITDGTTTYTQHALPFGFYRGNSLGEAPVCRYKNSLEWDGYYTISLYEPGGDSGILFAESYSLDLDGVYFATDEAEAELQAFFGGQYRNFALSCGANRAERILVPVAQKNTILSSYAGSVATRNVDVSTIDKDYWFPLVAKDKSGTFSVEIGALLVLNQSWYYADFTTLDNSHFDADGRFSFRSGTITVRQLAGDAVTVANALATRYFDGNDDDLAPVLAEGKTLESVAEDNEANATASFVLFWVLYVFAGFVLPAAGLTVGLIFATRQKPHARRWFIVVGIAGLWLLISGVVLILLLV